MSIVIFWIQESTSGLFPSMSQPMCHRFKDIELSEALTFCNTKRKEAGVSHVTLSSENPNSVGQPGVDSIVDGKTPDGHAYEWSKQHRGGQRL